MDQSTHTPAPTDQLDLPMPQPAACPFGPAPAYTALRAETPVVRVTCPTGISAWLVTRYHDVREALGDADRFSSRSGQVPHLMAHADPGRPVGEGEFTRMDGPEYRRFRRTIGPELSSPKRLAALRPTVQAVIDERLDALAAAGPPADLYHDFAIPITTAAIGGLVGVPYADRELFHNAAAAVFDGMTDEAELAAAFQPLQRYLFALVQRRRAEPGDDALSRIIARSAESDRPFTDFELVAMNAVMLVAGFDNTASVLAHGVLALLSDQDQLDRLRSDPALVPAAVEEIVRLLGGSAGIMREATCDTRIGDQPIAKGDLVLLAIQAADHDPAMFPAPGRLDITRLTDGHLGFGYGTHQCFGEQTARLELTLALETLLRRVPSLALDVPLDRIPFKTGTPVIGPERVPVTWDEILPASGQAR